MAVFEFAHLHPSVFSLQEVSFVDQFPPSRSKYLPGAWSTLEIHSRLSNFPNYKYEVKYE